LPPDRLVPTNKLRALIEEMKTSQDALSVSSAPLPAWLPFTGGYYPLPVICGKKKKNKKGPKKKCCKKYKKGKRCKRCPANYK
jgi:hypothetical protein